MLVASGAALAACAPGANVSREALAGWESSYVPASACERVVALGGVPSGTDGVGTLVVRLAAFDSSALLEHSQIVVTPLAPMDTLEQPVERREDASERPAPYVVALRPGRYALAVRAFGHEGRTDTVVVRPGASDTVTLALEEHDQALRNLHNCRPHGFRHAGERACVTDRITAVPVLDRARVMASPGFRFGVGLPQGDSSGVHIVDDERVCQRAARVYGLGSGPPRRVVVAEAVGFYVVYDPAEPVPFGELDEWLVIDRNFRVLARLAL